MMLTWLVQNIATILICLVLALIVAAIIGKLVLDKKRGKASCGCHCGSCPMDGSCHKH